MRAVTTANKELLSPFEVCKRILSFHLTARLLQRSIMTDVTWGIAPPALWNNDQVPIELLMKNTRTIDHVGNKVVWISSGTESDEKRFCTANLWIPMEVLPDQMNLPRIHVVFRATKFCPGESWTGCDKAGQPRERDLWHPDCIVSFQANAWVDTETNIYCLQKMKPMHDAVRKRHA